MAEKSILSSYPDYEVTIGMEVHVQLKTKSKIFCACPNEIADQPNLNICPICAGHPGTLPVLNKEVVTSAIKAGIATNCTINNYSECARKHYFYPDLPKGYQITQADKPVCSDGFIKIRLENGQEKKIRIMRIHLEEDAGKNIHAASGNESFVDLNRAGTPLLEIVTHPDISSAEETRHYLKSLRSIVMYLNICSGNMEDGAFRADTNISVRKKGATKLGTKVELKNINSFKFISDAIEYEIERQIKSLENGTPIIQETRLWDSCKHITISMRSKEEAADYRYFPDPDLPPIIIDKETIENSKKSMPELPDQKFEKYVTKQGLSAYEAEILINDVTLATYYEDVYSIVQSKHAINLILRDVMGYLKENKIELKDFKVTPSHLASLVELLEKDLINSRAAQEIFAECAISGKNPEIIVKEKGLEQVSDSSALEEIINAVIKENPSQVAGFKSGNERLLGFFVGQIMQKTQGKANPKTVNELLKKYLS